MIETQCSTRESLGWTYTQHFNFRYIFT